VYNKRHTIREGKQVMNINRHNYESFFLLYIDNELSVKERTVLELFVQENTDLQKELDMLKQSIVPADKIIFNGKNNLLKPQMVSAETEEQLLLYIDNELDKTEVKDMELLLATDESVAKELQLLYRTKISPDGNIVFADKQSLYRKEPNRVIPIVWWKLAVAAAFIGFCTWGAAVYLNGGRKVVINETASNTNVKPGKVAKDLPATTLPVEKKDPAEIAVAVTPQQLPNETTNQKLAKSFVKSKQKTSSVQQDNDMARLQKINSAPSNNLPKPYFENNNDGGSNKNDPANVTRQMQDINTNNIAVTGNPKNVQPTESNSTIYTAAFTDNSNENKEGPITFSDEEPKKSKLSGFLRKAKRVLERNTKMKNGDNNIKVANLEFAIQ
jgi:hypothetical protein